ncbi:hypothetical protein M422DRAFT_76389 [Sphaerobolus stellatus SS14]|uniref:N-acetyltransferase domain-containing protein n=1 Tax=Sphaerobolus stellatus (strain SS14) TaxID=990650 RepID=A0A0C9UIM2_SPHS4|nr:hypothetical protein M422DRAFT_76389 [Sphaerobolus stellatus SS14]
MSASQITIEIAPPSAAQEITLIEKLAVIVNTVYTDTESDLFHPNCGNKRTNPDQIKQYISAGELAIAYTVLCLPSYPSSSSSIEGHQAIGCIRIMRHSSTHGEFGMLAVDSTHRGGGTGRAMVRFAEAYCKAQLCCSAIQLELLFPTTFEHVFKMRLQEWYLRMGYKIVKHVDVTESRPDLASLLAYPCEWRVFEKSLDQKIS